MKVKKCSKDTVFNRNPVICYKKDFFQKHLNVLRFIFLAPGILLIEIRFYCICLIIKLCIFTIYINEPQLTQIYWKWSPSNYCSTLEIIFVHYKIRISKISFRNCVSLLLSTHYRAFLFTGPFDLTKAQSL